MGDMGSFGHITPPKPIRNDANSGGFRASPPHIEKHAGEGPGTRFRAVVLMKNHAPSRQSREPSEGARKQIRNVNPRRAPAHDPREAPDVKQNKMQFLFPARAFEAKLAHLNARVFGKFETACAERARS